MSSFITLANAGFNVVMYRKRALSKAIKHLSVLNDLYKKNNVIHDHNTRTKDMFRVSLGTQTFSTVSARIWNALNVKFNVNVPLTRFKVSLKLYLSSNILTISYPK